jgi:hypothetical protein
MPLVDPVLVLADQADDDVAPTPETRELLMLARRVGMPVLVTCEPGDPDRAAEVLINIARSTCPRAVLITAKRSTEMISARVAVSLECAIVSEITDLSVEDDRLLIVQESAHGKDCEEGGEGGERIVSEIHTRTAVLTVHRREHDRGRELVLTEADVVVAGGRGAGSAEGFSLLARVAYVLGGCLGGTHTAGELGWCPPHARISFPARRSARASTWPAAYQDPYATARRSAAPERSWPSTATRARRSSVTPTSASSAICTRSCPRCSTNSPAVPRPRFRPRRPSRRPTRRHPRRPSRPLSPAPRRPKCSYDSSSVWR